MSETCFRVASDGELSLIGGVNSPVTNADYIDELGCYPQKLLVASSFLRGFEDCVDSQMGQFVCSPLQEAIEEISYDFEDQIDHLTAKLEEAELSPEPERSAQSIRETLSQLEKKQKALMAWESLDPEKLVGVAATLTEHEVEEAVVPKFQKWLKDEPDLYFLDWLLEQNIAGMSPTSDAFNFFADMNFVDLKALGVSIVDGEMPGSSYRAAVLTSSIENANAAAKERSLEIRFIGGA